MRVCLSCLSCLIVTLALACTPPPPAIDLDGGAEGEGEGEGESEGEPLGRTEIIAAFCDRLEACGNGESPDCQSGVGETFADLDANGCRDAATSLETFYACALDLSCGALAGPPPQPGSPCGDEFAAADDAIAQGACFGSCTETLGVLDGCDCGCGDDPDCLGQGCAEPGCAAPACDFCYDGNGIEVACPAG